MTEESGTHYNTDEAYAEPEFVEMDPTGRYGRYDEILGKGAFKTVYRAFDEVDGIEVAWNQVKVQDLLQNPEELERLYSEVNLLKSLKHKNIIKFYTSWVDAKNKNVNFITEVFNSGTLRQYRKKHKHVDIRAVKSWARQILRGLLYLHSHDPPVIHRDLKCDNIFVNGNNGEVKIGDLGLATILRQAHAAHSVIGTPEFMAPELYEEEYNELVDIYSFGMCLLEIVTFEYPYSECTNAAQIYKKVTSGKKPAALDKVKDPDVRKFIENCLAVASKRLPARELLSDPFLQCDTNKEQSECPSMVVAQMESVRERLGSVTKEQGESSLCHLTSKLENAEPKTDACFDESKSSVEAPLKSVSSNEALSNSDCDSGTVSGILQDEQSPRGRDFRVKGKKKDENTVSLRLRIADSQGHVRYIHFVFDIESDTAISVASEMVEELQLSDQDVTTVAEMIDAQILSLVPDWKPGASFEDATPDTGHSDQDNCVTDVGKRSEDELDVDAALDDCVVSSLIEEDIYSSVFGQGGPDEEQGRGEGMMYGRFEDVTYNQGGSDYSPSSSGAPPPVSSISFDQQALEDSVFTIADHTSKSFDPAEKELVRTTHNDSESLGKPITLGICDADPSKIEFMAFNDLVECQRNAGSSKYTHQTWEMIMNMSSCPSGHDAYAEAEAQDMDKGSHSPLPWPSGASTAVTPTDLTDDEELDQELKNLAFEQEQELVELRKKHEIAISEARSRWEKKSGSIISSKLVWSRLQNDSISVPETLHDTCGIVVSLERQGQASGCVTSTQSLGSVSPPIDWEARLATARENTPGRKQVDSDRLSLEELSAMSKQTCEETGVIGSAAQLLCSRTSDAICSFNAMDIHSELSDIIYPGAGVGKCITTRSHPEGHMEEQGQEEVVPKSSSEACMNSGNLSTTSSTSHPFDPIAHIEEGGSRNAYPDNVGERSALNDLKLCETESLSFEDLNGKVEVKGKQMLYTDILKDDEKSMCPVSEASVPLQKCAASASIPPDTGACKSEHSSFNSAHEGLGSRIEAHTNPNRVQVLSTHESGFEKPLVQPNVVTTSGRTDTGGDGPCSCSPVVITSYKNITCVKATDKVTSDKKETPQKATTKCQVSGSNTESREEQLQRSIARLEAKTLEGLQIGLTANLGTKKLSCSPMKKPSGSTSNASQSRPNSASETSKH
ncbi:hypothetical protein KP509_36G000400 [Ceratopteris richardii]|uniref:non-specific serine/threonine protein kinase n=1 Tax=Ceratopteris richardii TaxID=49495 RepID=A0A8T2Q9Q4_CERRI|nr:hypothetical protein KP509_36G000400 [Ceratopteris richardii]